MSQSDLAARVGCKQSALSMFESGFPTKLSRDAVEAIAGILGVSLEITVATESPTALEGASLGGIPMPGLVFCPSPECLSNVPYVVDGRVIFRPARNIFPLGQGPRCPHCGEILELRCPACGALINEGACCATCGSPYIAGLPMANPASWVAARRTELTSLRELLGLQGACL